MTKVFQRSVGQFILSPSVVRAKDAMSIDALFFSGLAELAINGLFHTKDRNDHAIMIQTRQRELADEVKVCQSVASSAAFLTLA